MSGNDHTHDQVQNPALVVIDGQPRAKSTDVARHFGKLHKDVLKAIKNMEVPENFRERNFAPSEYTVPGQTRKYPMFEMTRDGFTLLTMGFNGKRAMEWKLAYIAEWNRMEAALKDVHENLHDQIRQEMGRLQERTIQTTAEIVIDQMQKRLLELEVRLDRRTAAVDHMSARQLLDQEKVPSKKRRGLIFNVSRRLRKFCSSINAVALRSAETSTWLFPISAIKKWMKLEGKRLIQDHLATIYGQMEMDFNDEHTAPNNHRPNIHVNVTVS